MCDNPATAAMRRLFIPPCIFAIFLCLLGATALAFKPGALTQARSEPATRPSFSPCRSDALFDRPSLPARIGYMPLGAYCTLENHSAKRIVRYRLGCVVEERSRIKILSKRKEEVSDLPPADSSKSRISFTALSVSRIKNKCVAKGAKVAVVEVNFADGTAWNLGDYITR